jgi:hypothetical protein
MADKKITDLQLIASLAGTESYPVDDAIQTYRATVNQMRDYIQAQKTAITARTEETVLNQYADMLLLWDASADALRKMRVTNLMLARTGFRNLTGINNSGTPTTQYDIAADEVVLTNSSGQAIVKLASGTLTNNISTAGSAANGRDQSGAFTNPSWVHFWMIYNPTTDTLASLSSASATAPTLPTDYTHKAYVGAVYYDGSLHVTYIRGRDAFYKTSRTALSAGTATSDTSVSVSTLVPPNAYSYLLSGRGTGDENGSQEADWTYTVGVASATQMYNARLGMRGGGAFTPFVPINGVILPNLSQTFYYKVANTLGTNGSLTMECVSYSLPNGAA